MDQTISLSTNEWRLMDLLWEKSPRTVTELLHISQREIGWGKHTILTMLSRLEAKGAVRHEQGPRAKNFYPAIPRDATARAAAEQFLSKVYGGSLGTMVNAMVREISPQELSELRRILDQAEQEEV